MADIQPPKLVSELPESARLMVKLSPMDKHDPPDMDSWARNYRKYKGVKKCPEL
jgi:hypothetical protein